MAPAPRFSVATQQEMILNAAVQSISETSVTDFTMASVARLAKLSMGSIYKFVQSKEDIVLALAHQSFTHLSATFQKVLALPLSAPEKLVAVCLISPAKTQLFEFEHDLQSYATNEAVIRRASPMWTNKMIEACGHCEAIFKLTLANDIKAGELEQVPNLNEVIEEIVISGWAMTVGYEEVRRVKQTSEVIDGTDSLQEPLALNDPMVRSMVRLLNTYPWRKPITQQSLQLIEQQLISLDLR